MEEPASTLQIVFHVSPLKHPIYLDRDVNDLVFKLEKNRLQLSKQTTATNVEPEIEVEEVVVDAKDEQVVVAEPEPEVEFETEVEVEEVKIVDPETVPLEKEVEEIHQSTVTSSFVPLVNGIEDIAIISATPAINFLNEDQLAYSANSHHHYQQQQHRLHHFQQQNQYQQYQQYHQQAAQQHQLFQSQHLLQQQHQPYSIDEPMLSSASVETLETPVLSRSFENVSFSEPVQIMDVAPADEKSVAVESVDDEKPTRSRKSFGGSKPFFKQGGRGGRFNRGGGHQGVGNGRYKRAFNESSTEVVVEKSGQFDEVGMEDSQQQSGEGFNRQQQKPSFAAVEEFGDQQKQEQQQQPHHHHQRNSNNRRNRYSYYNNNNRKSGANNSTKPEKTSNSSNSELKV